MKKIIYFEFDNHIMSIDDLIYQLESLKFESRLNMPLGDIFVKDYHALRIVINFINYYIKEVFK